MAEIINITSDDLLRLNHSEEQIRHIFKTLISDINSLSTNGSISLDDYVVSIDKENRYIEFKSITDFKDTLHLIIDDELYVTENIGKYKVGDSITNKELRDLLQGILVNLKDVGNPDDAETLVVQPSIDCELILPECIKSLERDGKVYVEVGSTNYGKNNDPFKLQVSTDPGKYPWGPDTGVIFQGLQVTLDGESFIVNTSIANNQRVQPEAEYVLKDTKENFYTRGFSSSGQNRVSVNVKSSHTNGVDPYKSDKHTPQPDAAISPATALSGGELDTSAHSSKNFIFYGYYNCAYLGPITSSDAGDTDKVKFNNKVNKRDGSITISALDLPTEFTTDNLQNYFIAIICHDGDLQHLYPEIKEIRNRRTGIPQPFEKVCFMRFADANGNMPGERIIDLSTGIYNTSVTDYLVYKISNTLAESTDNETYDIIYKSASN